MKKFLTILFAASFLSACTPAPLPAPVPADTGWISYHNDKVGVTFSYPSNYTPPDVFQNQLFLGASGTGITFTTIHVGDGVPEGQAVQVYRINDKRIPAYLQTDKPFTQEKEVNGLKFNQYQFDGMADPYGYVTEKNGYYYVFSATWGPDNPVAEQIFKTLRID